MKIAYDVMTVIQMTIACQRANDELQRAQNLLQEIRSHSDWGCKEKDTIDDLVRDSRNMIRKLCENQSAFLRAVQAAEGELTGAENSVSGLFNAVESLLAKILAVPVKDVVISGAGLGIGFGLEGIRQKGQKEGFLDYYDPGEQRPFESRLPEWAGPLQGDSMDLLSLINVIPFEKLNI